MKSNGGQVGLRHAAHRPVELALSGLAAGMIAGELFADSVDSDLAVTLDMGGTSTDVGVIIGKSLRHTGSCEIEWGIPIALPVVDVTTIGAGGSSIAAVDAGGLLHVGPASAGAVPGPAAYKLGGTAATITDANLVLGRLNPDYFLDGEISLSRTTSETGLSHWGTELERAGAGGGEGGSAPGAVVGAGRHGGGGHRAGNGRLVAGPLAAFDPGHLQGPIWRTGLSGPVLGAVSAIPGAAVVAAGSSVVMVDSSGGGILWQASAVRRTAAYPAMFYEAASVA